jgi:hypothetical protein
MNANAGYGVDGVFHRFRHRKPEMFAARRLHDLALDFLLSHEPFELVSLLGIVDIDYNIRLWDKDADRVAAAHIID